MDTPSHQASHHQGLLIAVGLAIVVLLGFMLLVPKSDLKTLSNKFFAIGYPKDFKVRSSLIPNSPYAAAKGDVQVAFIASSLKDPSSSNSIYIVAEPTVQTTVPSSKTNQEQTAGMAKDATNKNFQAITINGAKGTRLTWQTKSKEHPGTYLHDSYTQVIKNHTEYTLQVSYDDSQSTFKQQVPAIINSFKVK